MTALISASVFAVLISATAAMRMVAEPYVFSDATMLILYRLLTIGLHGPLAVSIVVSDISAMLKHSRICGLGLLAMAVRKAG